MGKGTLMIYDGILNSKEWDKAFGVSSRNGSFGLIINHNLKW